MADRDTHPPIDDPGDDGFIDELFDPNDPAVANDPLLQVIKHVYDTINTLITDTNTNNSVVDKVKDNLSSNIDLDTMKSDVAANTAKTGITSTQANAITTNTGICEGAQAGRFRKVSSTDGKASFDTLFQVTLDKNGNPDDLEITLTNSKGKKFKVALSLSSSK